MSVEFTPWSANSICAHLFQFVRDSSFLEVMCQDHDGHLVRSSWQLEKVGRGFNTIISTAQVNQSPPTRVPLSIGGPMWALMSFL